MRPLQIQKEKIKEEIDALGDGALLKLARFIETLKNQPRGNISDLPKFSLQGRFDRVDIRSLAYE